MFCAFVLCITKFSKKKTAPSGIILKIHTRKFPVISILQTSHYFQTIVNNKVT